MRSVQQFSIEKAFVSLSARNQTIKVLKSAARKGDDLRAQEALELDPVRKGEF